MLDLQFQALGFNQREALVYLSLAESGKSTAAHLAKKTEIPRATVYFILDTLVQRGLVSKEKRKGTTFFIAGSPETLVRIAQQECEEANKRLEVAAALKDAVAPYFQSQYFSVPKLQFYEGRESVLSMLHDNIEAWRTSMGRHDFTWWGYEDWSLYEHYKDWFHAYWERSAPREETGEKVRLFSDVEAGEKVTQMFPSSLFRKVPKGHDFTTTVWVLGDYIVMIMTRHEPHYAFQIHDAVFASNQRAVFQLLWNASSE